MVLANESRCTNGLEGATASENEAYTCDRAIRVAIIVGWGIRTWNIARWNDSIAWANEGLLAYDNWMESDAGPADPWDWRIRVVTLPTLEFGETVFASHFPAFYNDPSTVPPAVRLNSIGEQHIQFQEAGNVVYNEQISRFMPQTPDWWLDQVHLARGGSTPAQVVFCVDNSGGIVDEPHFEQMEDFGHMIQGMALVEAEWSPDIFDQDLGGGLVLDLDDATLQLYPWGRSFLDNGLPALDPGTREWTNPVRRILGKHFPECLQLPPQLTDDACPWNGLWQPGPSDFNP